jgi:hypothetical protein
MTSSIAVQLKKTSITDITTADISFLHVNMALIRLDKEKRCTKNKEESENTKRATN